MTRDELRERMAKAVYAAEGQNNLAFWENTINDALDNYDGELPRWVIDRKEASGVALSALCSALPGLADVIDGKAVIVPVGPSAAMVDVGARSLRGAGLGRDCYSAAGCTYAAMIEARPK